MSKKKISVVGKGTAGSQSLIHFLRYFPEHEITWYFDPTKPAQSVGEGSALQFPRNLHNNLGFFQKDLKTVNGTFKTGIYKENWGTKNKSFFHDFEPPGVGYHFNAVEMQNYIYEKVKDKVRIVEEEVDYKNLDTDFILNASGKPEGLDQFEKSDYIPVNAAYVVQCSWEYPKFEYTLAIAGKHGWIFGIPLQNRCSIGYIYNKDISLEEDLLEDMEKIFKRYGLTPSSSPNKINFDNYYRKENYEDGGRIVHNGNASFFLEPLEATSIGTMDNIQRTAFDLWNNNLTADEANHNYLKQMHQTELVLMLHYAAGSRFKSDFWKYAQELGIEKIKNSYTDLEFRRMFEVSKEISEMRFIQDFQRIGDYGTWWVGSFAQNLKGLDLYKKINKILN
jgi:hypothetical protein